MTIKKLTCGLLVGSSLLAASIASAVTPSPVSITQVNPATDGSDNYVIEGRIDATQNISSFDINGYAPMTFDGNSFSLQMPKTDHYQINLHDSNGGYQALNYAAPSVAVDSAIQVVVSDQLMQDLGPAMGTLLTDLNLNDILGIGPNQCVVDTYWLIGCDLYIKKLELQGTPKIDLSFTPSNGEQLTVNINMDIPRAVMSTKIKRAWWWGYRNTTVTTDDIKVSLQVGVKATADQSIKLVLDEPSDVQLRIGKMRVSSNTLAAHLIPVFKDVIADVVNRHVANVAGPFLNHLPIPSIPLSLPIDVDGDSVNDAEFAINMNAQLLDVLAGGDGQAVLAGSISSAQVAPGRDAIGSRRIGGFLPGAEPVVAPTDVSAAVSVDLANQILLAVYQSGVEEKVVLPLKVRDLGEVGAVLPFLGYALDDDLNIRLSFAATPELQVNNSSLYPLGLEIVIPELTLDIAAVTANGEETIMNITSDVVVATSLAAQSDGKLQLEFGNLLALNNLVVNGGVLADQLPPEQMAAIITVVLPDVVADFEPMINDLLNVARLELDIGEMLSDWLQAEFPSVPVTGYITETGVSEDESYMMLGVGIDL